MAEQLDDWWKRVNADDRALFTRHRHDTQLPSGLVGRFNEYHVRELADGQGDDRPLTYRWTPELTDFLERKAAEAGDP